MKRLFLKVAFVLLLAASALSQVSQEKAEKYALEFRPSSGTKLTYFLNSAITTTGKNFLGNDISLGASVSGETGLAVGTVTADTVSTLFTTPGIQVDVHTNEQTSHSTIATKEGMSLEAIFSRTGKLEEMRNVEALTRQYILNMSVVQILRDCFPTFSNQKVGLGESWSDSRRMLIPFLETELDVVLDSKCTLSSVQMSDRGPLATISVDYSVQLGGKKPLGEASGTFEGKGSGRGFLYFLIDRGYFTEYRIDHRTEASLVIKKDETKLLEYPFNLTVFVSVVLTGVY